MPNFEHKYAELLRAALNQTPRQTRNAITRGYFGDSLVTNALYFDELPLLQGRKLYWKGVVGELAAFLRGPKFIEDFQDMGCNYWNAWSDTLGTINVDYGNAWLDFNGVNQLEEVVNSLKTDPYGRRHLISGWRPDKLKTLSLPCCHYSYQWYVNNDNELEMIWNQRSVDLAIGLPSDLLLAAVWNILMAQTVGLKPGKLHLMLGDCHIYESHIPGVLEYLDRPLDLYRDYIPCTWKLDPEATVFNFMPHMFEVPEYYPQGAIQFKLEV